MNIEHGTYYFYRTSVRQLWIFDGLYMTIGYGNKCLPYLSYLQIRGIEIERKWFWNETDTLMHSCEKVKCNCIYIFFFDNICSCYDMVYCWRFKNVFDMYFFLFKHWHAVISMILSIVMESKSHFHWAEIQIFLLIISIRFILEILNYRRHQACKIKQSME